MIDWKKILQNTPVRSVRSVLYELATLNRKEADKLPAVSVFTRGGKTFSGSVVKVEQDRQEEILILHVSQPLDRWTVQNSIVYLQLSEIMGVSLDNADDSPELIGLITGGKFENARALEPVSKLNFRRYLQEKSTALAAQLGNGFLIKADDAVFSGTENFAGYQSCVEQTVAVLDEILRDALGREALQAKVNKLLLTVAEDFAVTLSGQTMRLSVNAQAVNQQLPSHSQLQEAIEKVL